MTTIDPIGGARIAVDDGRWQDALDALDSIDGRGLAHSADALELRAQAAYGIGAFEDAVAAWESLHELLERAGDRSGAARAAAMVAMYLMMDTGLMAPVRGWLSRADRLLEGIEECPAHAVVEMVRTYERFMCGDMVAAGKHAAAAIDLGERLDVRPAVVIGRVASARVTILDGRVDEGLALLDEVAALLMSSAVDPLTTGMMYCELICAAQGLALHERAAEWTEIMEQWRHGAAFGGINGRCRVHRAEMLRMTGPCAEAEEEALAACDELRPWMRREFGWPLVELGTIRLRKGDLAGAEEAFLAAHEHAWSPMPGLALLRLAQGDAAAAVELIAEAIAHPIDIPSKERPPFGDLRLAPLLDAQAEIAASVGDVDTCEQAAASLGSIAERYPSRSLNACAALAAARAAALRGELGRATDAGAFAVAEWTDVGAPFESAKARLVLADAHQRAGNLDSARLEWRAAHATFEAFGAVRWAEHAQRMLDGLGASPTGSPVVPDSAEFRRDGDTRHVRFAGLSVTLRDLKGFRYLERMLASPGREFHVLDLVAVEAGALPAGGTGAEDLELVDDAHGMPMIDEQARDAYRRRLAEVDQDIEEATRMNDLGRVELAERDRQYLIAELGRAVGLGGRLRAVGGSAEKARTSVTRTLRYSLARLGEHHPPLAAHLDQRIRTGTYCTYLADPLVDVRWTV